MVFIVTVIVHNNYNDLLSNRLSKIKWITFKKLLTPFIGYDYFSEACINLMYKCTYTVNINIVLNVISHKDIPLF